MIPMMIMNLVRDTKTNCYEEKYIKPVSEVVGIELTTMLAMSGWGDDSDDSEFGAPAKRRETWGDLWK